MNLPGSYALWAFGFCAVVAAICCVLILQLSRARRSRRRAEEALAAAQENLARVHHLEDITASRLRESVLGLREFLSRLNEKVQAHAAAYSQLSAMMEEFAASIESSNAATARQVELIDSVSQQAGEVEGLLRTIRGAGEELQAQIEEARAGGESVTQSARDLSRAMDDIEKAFATVSQVTKIMSEVSDRTNLLSLNASIEAARSGEHGRGFAVVAEEISKLAERSAANAKQISAVVLGNASAISTGHASANVAASKVQEQRSVFLTIAERYDIVTESVRAQIGKSETLVGTIRSLRDLSAEIGGTAREQKAGIDSAMKSLLEMESSTSSLVNEANFLEMTARLIEDQAQSLQSDYHEQFRRAEQRLISEVRAVLEHLPYEPGNIDGWLARAADKMPAAAFRLYLCSSSGSQLSSNFIRRESGFAAQPEFRGANWSGRAYFAENMSRVERSGGGSLSGQYIDRETARETVTLTLQAAEDVYLFVDLTPDFTLQ